MQKAAIYARFSSDLQRDQSIEDQVVLCKNYAARNKFKVVEIFEDRARSGASLFGRAGLLNLMDRAKEGGFDVIIVEALDRLSRDSEDLHGIYKRLSFAGIDVMAVHDGKADHVQVGIRGLVGEMYLKDLAHKTRRGLAGVVREGRSAGGKAYGYKPVLGMPGKLSIVEEEANIVCRIFREYLEGKSPRAIASGLNADGIKPPRGRFWMASTINGSQHRNNGMLLNPIYSGKIIWNRVRMLKDPDTGKRISRSNPKHEWHITEVPELRIVPAEVFDAVQKIRTENYVQHKKPVKKSTHLLSGILKCGCCGSGMSIKDKKNERTRIMCSQSRLSDTCKHRTPYYLDAIEKTTTEGLIELLQDKEAIQLYIKTYNDERQALAADTINKRTKLENSLAKIEGELTRTIDLVIRNIIGDEDAKERIADLKTKKAEAIASLQSIDNPPNVVALHPTAIKNYMEMIQELDNTLREKSPAASEEAKTALRSLVNSIVVHPAVEKQIKLDINGHLSNLLGNQAFMASDALCSAGGYSMVARERFSPIPPNSQIPFFIVKQVA